MCLAYGPKVLGAALIFIVGMWVIRRVTRGFDLFLEVRKVDQGLRTFFLSLSNIALKVALVIIVASTVGIETTSFIAIFSAIAFSIGLALQGSLGNFASGVLILLFKPFKIGDFLTVSGFAGEVVEIQVFCTILKANSGKRIIIPNGKMLEGPIENIIHGSEVVVEAVLLLNSNTPLEKLRQVVETVAKECPFAISGKAPEVKVRGISRDDMKVEISVWAKGEDNEDATFFLNEALLKAFSSSGIELAKERRRETI
jgi:small conductance mechanosensitive channel